MNNIFTPVIVDLGQANQLFLANSSIKNVYISDTRGIVDVYVRKAHHMVNGKLISTFDIANISVDSRYQGNGIGSEVFATLHKSHSRSATYIENVLNCELSARLKKQGWLDVPDTPMCMYKYLGE